MTYIPPNPNGQTTAANSSPVVLASDQSSVPVLNSSPTTTPVSAGVTASGDTTVIAATTGKQIKLFWYHLQAKGTNSANVTAIVKGTIGGVSTAINTADYIANQAFAHTVGSGNRSIIFDSNTPVVVNLSAAQPVWFNAEYDLI